MNFGFLIFPGVEELDLVGPWEMVRMWSLVAQGPEQCVIVAERKEPVLRAKGMSIVPDVTFDECPALDFLLVPGGRGTRTEVDNERLIAFIARQAAHCQIVLSVCTGAFLLHRAGLLAGKKATTHWELLDSLRALGDVTVVEERFVVDPPVWSSAGVSAGIDMTLALIDHVAGEESAGKVQLYSEYYPSGKIYGGVASSPPKLPVISAGGIDVPWHREGKGEEGPAREEASDLVEVPLTGGGRPKAWCGRGYRAPPGLGPLAVCAPTPPPPRRRGI